MEAVEDYIKKYTRNYSNEILVNSDESYTNIPSKGEYHPWLTPEHARSVAEIAREETIKEVCEWINRHLNYDYISTDEESVRMGCPYSYLETNLFIEDLKKHFKGKL